MIESCCGLAIVVMSLLSVTKPGPIACCFSMAIGLSNDWSNDFEVVACLHTGVLIVTFLEAVGRMTSVLCNLLLRA